MKYNDEFGFIKEWDKFLTKLLADLKIMIQKFKEAFDKAGIKYEK